MRHRSLTVTDYPHNAGQPRGTILLIKVFVAGDVRLHREGLAVQLSGFPSLEILGSGTVTDALQVLRSDRADVALLDLIQLGIPAAVSTLRQAQGRIRVIAMGVRDIESEVLACAAAGIDGYVRMDAAIDEVLAVVEGVMRGELVCSPKVAATLFHSVASLSADGSAVLTNRELQVVELMNHGLSNKEISRRLRIESSTAKNHVQNIMQKLGVHRRGQAVAKLRSAIGQRFS
jgi:DNA-binding NarL/FixJ family response regulator